MGARLLTLAIVVTVLVFAGHWLRNMLVAGHWWVVPFCAVAIFLFGWWVAPPDEKEDFAMIWRRLTAWLVR